MRTKKARKRSRMGRPPKPPAERYSEQANIRMTRAERARLDAEASRLGLTLSQLLMRPWRDPKREPEKP
jgi:hypothetical protein